MCSGTHFYNLVHISWSTTSKTTQTIRKPLFLHCFYAVHQQSYAISSTLGSSSFYGYSYVTPNKTMHLCALPYYTRMNLILFYSSVTVDLLKILDLTQNPKLLEMLPLKTEHLPTEFSKLWITF